ncbi:MAG: hypothetical protein PHO32_05715 [Candidatus Cloacimonetes bacterium]|nr:hypothetical protein [Candidatus Cloacimonadota bacterium]
MKNILLNTVLISLLTLLLLVSACCKNKKCNTDTSVEPGNFNYTGSTFEGNYIWGGAMNLAWNELIDNWTNEAIELFTDDAEALATLNKLNNPVFTRKNMDEASYYIKSGYGQQTVDAINKECSQKFPKKSIPELKLKLGANDIISYAYFLKEITYQKVFSPRKMDFNDTPVEGFAAYGESANNIYILDYQNEDKFLIGIKLQDDSDQIFLAKGYPMDNPEEIVKELRSKAPLQTQKEYSLGQPMNRKDRFSAPKLHLDNNRAYSEMIGKKLKNKKLAGYVISVMQEIIKFDMDEKGARVENEAIIGMVTSAGPNDTYKPKSMILDKPYWVMMKRFDSNNPYFILGVQNTGIMKAAASD